MDSSLVFNILFSNPFIHCFAFHMAHLAILYFSGSLSSIFTPLDLTFPTYVLPVSGGNGRGLQYLNVTFVQLNYMGFSDAHVFLKLVQWLLSIFYEAASQESDG